MNMYLHEMRAYRKSTIIWSISLALVAIMMLSVFSSFSANIEEVKKAFSKLTPEMLRAFGINIDAFSFFTGFYAFIFIYLNLCGAIQAMNLGTSLVSKETTRKTADFLLTKPVSRHQILTAKLMAGLTSILITDLVFFAVARAMAAIVSTDPIDEGMFFMISITLLFLQLMFLAMGTIVSVIASKIKSVISVSLSTVFAFFIIRMIASALSDEALRYITPFEYFSPSYVQQHASYEITFVIIGAVFVIAAITASYVIYSKKEIHAV